MAAVDQNYFEVSPNLTPSMQGVFREINYLLQVTGMSARELESRFQQTMARNFEDIKLSALIDLSIGDRINGDLMLAQRYISGPNKTPPYVMVSGFDKSSVRRKTQDEMDRSIQAVHEQLNAFIPIQKSKSVTLNQFSKKILPGWENYYRDTIGQNSHFIRDLASGKRTLHPEPGDHDLSLIHHTSVHVKNAPYTIFLPAIRDIVASSLNKVFGDAFRTLSVTDARGAEASLNLMNIHLTYAAIQAYRSDTEYAATVADAPKALDKLYNLYEEHTALKTEHEALWALWARDYTSDNRRHAYAQLMANKEAFDALRYQFSQNPEGMRKIISERIETLIEAHIRFQQFVTEHIADKKVADKEPEVSVEELPPASFASYELDPAVHTAVLKLTSDSLNDPSDSHRNSRVWENIWRLELDPLRAQINRLNPAEAALGDAIFTNDIVRGMEHFTGPTKGKDFKKLSTPARDALLNAADALFKTSVIEALPDEERDARVALWERFKAAPAIIVVAAADATAYATTQQTYLANRFMSHAASSAFNEDFSKVVQPIADTIIRQRGWGPAPAVAADASSQEVDPRAELRSAKPVARHPGFARLDAVQQGLKPAGRSGARSA